jgi:hypothetical protein
MYDKEGSVLRIETTINRTEEFKVYRAKQGEPGGEKAWWPLQRSVGELWRRAQVSAAASRGEYTINGLRHRDVRRQLWAKAGNAQQERRRAAAVTRQLRLLRAHGLLRKVSGPHRDGVTEGGRKIITALLAARQADVEPLTALAA